MNLAVRRMHPPPHGPPRAITCLVVAILALPGCRRGGEERPAAARDTIERGPLRMTVTAEPSQVQVGDTIYVEVAVEAPPEYQVHLPEAADLGELQAAAGAAPDPRPGPEGTRWLRTYTIQPAVSGPLEIPALVVRYGPADGSTQPAIDNELVSRPIRLDVASALSKDDRPERPRDITGTLLPPAPPLPLWAKAALAGVTVLAAAAVYGLWRVLRQRRLQPAPPPAPEIWALRALRELDGTNWLDPVDARAAYYRLTAIICAYIEHKFGLAAPEMTTEEFLRTLARRDASLPCDPVRLQALLEACDIVKYAALQPRRADGEHALASARAFVAETAAAARPRAVESAAEPGAA